MTLWIVANGEVVIGNQWVEMRHVDLLPDRSVSRVGDVGDSDEVLGGQGLFSLSKGRVVEIDGSLKFRRHLLAREDLGDHCT